MQPSVIHFTQILNPFNMVERAVEDRELTPGTTVEQMFPAPMGAVEQLMTINGLVVEPEDRAKTYLSPGDCVVCCPIPQGGGGQGKAILRVAALIAIAVATAGTGAAAGGALLGTDAIGFAATYGALGVGVANAAISIGGGLLVNALFPQPKAGKNNASQSATYGIDGAKNTSADGVVVPNIYGTHRYGGNIINNYVVNDGNTQWLYMLMCCGEGPIKDIPQDSIEINEQPLTEFKDYEIQTRLGLFDQQPIGWFADTITPQSINHQLTTSFHTYTTSSPVDRLRFDFVAPAGMVYTGASGDTESITVPLEIEYRVHLTSTWLPLPSNGDVASYVEVLEYLAQSTALVDGTYSYTYYTALPGDFRDGDRRLRTIADPSGEGTTVLQVGTYVRRGVPGSVAITGHQQTPLRYSLMSAPLAEAVYDVRVRRTNIDAIDVPLAGSVDTIVWTDLNEIVNEDVAYRHTALLALKIRLTDQLNGLPTVTHLNVGRLVQVYDEANHVMVFEHSSNPAWIVFDILNNKRTGLGKPMSRFNMPKWREWAKYCAQKGLKFNGVFDTSGNIWDAVQDVCRTGHAQLLRAGSKYTVAIERPEEVRMMFTVANMIQGSFREIWLPTSDRSNEIEATYFDEDDKYRQHTIRAADRSPAALLSDPRTSQVELKGVTNAQQAWDDVWVLLNMNRYIQRSVEFSAPIESINFTVGDVIYVQHDMPAWGVGGKLEAGATTTVLNLDRPITLVTGLTYSCLVHHGALQRYSGTVTSFFNTSDSTNIVLAGFNGVNRVDRLQINGKDLAVRSIFQSGPNWGVVVDLQTGIANGQAYTLWATDVLETRTVLNAAPGEFTTITLTAPLSAAPAQYTNFMFGEVTKVAKPFRIKSIAGSHEYSRDISAIEYNATVYDPAGAVPTPNYSALTTAVEHVTIDGVEERLGSDGIRLQSRVTVLFSSAFQNYKASDVYLSRNGGRWELIGSDYGFVTVDATRGEVLEFQVVAKDVFNRSASRSTAPTSTYTVLGKTSPPGNVTGLIGVAVPGAIQIAWTANTEKEYRDTELRYGTSWATGVFLANVPGSSYLWARTTTAGVTIWARHRDTFGNYSVADASVVTAAGATEIPLNWDFTSGTADGWSNIDSVATTSDASGGSYGVASTPAAEYMTGRRIPIALDRKYRVRARVRRPSGGTGAGIVIIGALCYDSAGAVIGNPGGTGFPATATTENGVTIPNNNTWMVLEGEISGVNVGASPWTDMKKFFPGTVTVAPNIYWDASFNGNLHIDYVEIVDVTDAQISVGQSFSAYRTWDFNGSLEGWQLTSLTSVQGATGVTLTPTAGDPRFFLNGISINGAIYDKVRIRIRRTNPGTSWDGTLYYETAGHGFSASFYKTLPFSSMPGDQFAVLEFDMADLTAGGTDWRNSVITGLRFDLAIGTGTSYEVDWVSVGRYGPAGDLAQVSNSTWVANSLMTMFGDRAVRTSLAAGAWSGQVYSLESYTGGAYITGVAQRVGDDVFIGLNTDPTTDGSYTSIDYSLHWNSAGNVYAYNGATALNGGTPITTYVAGDVFGVFYDGQFIRYTKNGTTIWTQPATLSQLKLYADSSFYSAGSSVGGLSFGPMTNSSVSRGSNLIDASWWRPGGSGTPRWPANQHGSGGSDVFVLNQLPDGSTQPVWLATASTGVAATGGWEQGGTPDGNFFPIDTSKTYMFAILFKKVSGANDTSLWWGIWSNTVCDLNTTTPNSNPYFAGGFNPIGVVDRWYLAIGWVYPYNTTGHNHAQAGVWDTITGAKVHGGLNWNWAQNIQNVGTRAYQYYATAGNQAAFARPQAYLCDGSQPTLRDLLSSVANYGQDAMRVGFFNGWSGDYADGWGDWANGSTAIKETGLVKTAPYAVRFNDISTEQGWVSVNEFVGAPRAEGDYIEGEFEAYISSNTGSGYPGILVRAFFAGGLTLFEDLFVPVTNLVAGQWQRMPFKHSLQPGRSICAVHIYMMASWSSAPGGNSHCTVTFDNIQYRFQKRVDTPQIANQAATVVQQAFNASGTAFASAPDYGIWSGGGVVNTLSWANNAGEAVNVQIEHSVSAYLTQNPTTGVIGSCRWRFEYTLSGGGSGTETFSGPFEQTNPRAISHVKQVSVPAGQTITVTLRAQSLINSGTSVGNNWIDANTRLTAIKK